MDKPEIVINKKKKTKRIKPELRIIEESLLKKNIKLKSSSESSESNKTSKTRCKKGTKKYKQLGPGCFTIEDINNFRKLNSLES